MANPQVEDGHIDVANEIAEQLAKTYLSSVESRILWVIMRKTWGWHKKRDRISYSQLEEATGLNRRHIAPALKRLIARLIVTQTGNGHRLEYGIQKNYELWLQPIVTQTGNAQIQTLPKQVMNPNVTQTGNAPLLKQVTKTLPKQVITKEKKETIQKKDRGSKEPPDPRVSQIMLTLEQRQGYKFQYYERDVTAVKRALSAGYTPEQFIGCWEKMRNGWWKGKELQLSKVLGNLGEYVKGSGARVAPTFPEVEELMKS